MARGTKMDKGAQGMSAAAAFSAIDKKLWKPGSGCSGALDYMEQSSWLLFLRYLDAREFERRLEAGMTGKPYEPALPKRLRWSTWAYPTKPDGTFDYDVAFKGDELIQFVQHSLFPGLRQLKENADGADSIQYRIGAIFEQLNCRFSDGYLLREIIDLMQPLKFQTETERHEMSVAYESRLGEMGNAGRDGGQYYTPRPLIRVMIRLLNPEVGEKFDDGACGSAGFICEAYKFMREKARNDPKAYNVLQHKTFTGGEVKPLAYVTAQMNCILHGLETPNITFGDTLANKIADFTDKDRVNVIGANPPFGAGANKINAQNFTINTSETALMFMEYFMAKLKRGGRAAVIIKNTFLSNNDAASIAIRRMLLAKCQLHWVLDLPQKVFTAGVHTVVLFFTKDGPTTRPINYYQLDMKGVSLGKTRPLNENDLAEFEALVKKSVFPKIGELSKSECASHWQVDPKTIDENGVDLSVKNPNMEKAEEPTVAMCIESICRIQESAKKLISGLTNEVWSLVSGDPSTEVCELADVCSIEYGTRIRRKDSTGGDYPVYGGGGETFRWNTFNRSDCCIVSRFAMSEECVRFVKGNFFLNDSGLTVWSKDGKLEQSYLDWFLYSRQDVIYALGRGAAQKNLDMDEFPRIQIPIPSRETQLELVARLQKSKDLCEKIIEHARELVAQAEQLKRAYLKEAFE